MQRSAYGIGDPDACFEDVCLSYCCTCCAVNQMYQSAYAFGNPSTDGGANFNTGKFSPGAASNNACGACCCAFWCTPCMVGTVMNESIGMPWMLACCCVNPFTARNFERYQYRIAPVSGNDCMEECFWPYAMYFCGAACANFIPCLWCMICAGYIAVTMEMQGEAKMRTGGQNKKYLLGFTPAPAGAAVVMAPMYGQPQPQYGQPQPQYGQPQFN